MNKLCCAVAASACFLATTVYADPVTDAYAAALAAGKETLSLQKSCEKSVKRKDLAPCKSAAAAYDNYRAKAKAFTSSVPPEDLLNHVTPAQMDQITQLTQDIGSSMDKVNYYLE